MQKYDVAAYFVPSYTGDEPRSATFWPEGFGEWEIIKKATCRAPGHNWPRSPRWGYTNDADPYVMDMHIDAALEYGVNTFIYDWYWFDGRPYQEHSLNNGFLKAKNSSKMKFYLMWANHDATNMYDLRNSHSYGNTIWKGTIDRAEFERMTLRLIDKFFTQPNYYTIDGKPVFMIYEAANLVRGLGGMDEARRALDWLRESAIKAGLKGMHLQMTIWSETMTDVSGVDAGRDIPAYDVVDQLGFDSITHYQFVHFTNIKRNYLDILPDVRKEWDSIEKRSKVPYFPHISVGWDNSPRYKDFSDYIMQDNTPQNIEAGFRMAKQYADAHPGQAPLITLNAWNEWPESSYLMPDSLYGYGYLEAVKRVFGSARP